ncbi:hypothetical protein JCM3770_001527 [Rhodotorula araucariae]
MVAQLHTALQTVPALWNLMLPQERDGVLHSLLKAYCIACGPEGPSIEVWINIVTFNELKRQMYASHRSRATRQVFNQISNRVHFWEQIYNAPGPAATTSFSMWKHSFINPEYEGHWPTAGITPSKVQRLETATQQALLQVLDEFTEQVNKPPYNVLPALPTADTVLLEAHLKVQTPLERFHLYGDCVQDLFNIYEAQLCRVTEGTTAHRVLLGDLQDLRNMLQALQQLPQDPEPTPFEYFNETSPLGQYEIGNPDDIFYRAYELAHLHDLPGDRFNRCHGFLVDLVELYKGQVYYFAYWAQYELLNKQLAQLKAELRKLDREHFVSLPIQDQQRAVRLGRTMLYSACKFFQTHKMLPDAPQMTEPFYKALLGSSTQKLGMLAAHEHRSHLQHISDRKAQRYYGMTAEAWAAQRERAGW